MICLSLSGIFVLNKAVIIASLKSSFIISSSIAGASSAIKSDNLLSESFDVTGESRLISALAIVSKSLIWVSVKPDTFASSEILGLCPVSSRIIFVALSNLRKFLLTFFEYLIVVDDELKNFLIACLIHHVA